MNRLQPQRGNNSCSCNNGSNTNRNQRQNGHNSPFNFGIEAACGNYMWHFVFHRIAKLYKTF